MPAALRDEPGAEKWLLAWTAGSWCRLSGGRDGPEDAGAMAVDMKVGRRP